VAYGQAQAALSGFTKLTATGLAAEELRLRARRSECGVHAFCARRAASSAEDGQGQCIDLSQWEATLQLMGEGIMEYQLAGKEPGPNDGNRHARMSPHGVFRCPIWSRGTSGVNSTGGCRSPSQ